MAPANPVPFESTPDPAPIPSTGIQAGDPPPEAMGSHEPQLVSQEELNAWRRGFTPQAEIWNGRLAMVGLSVGLTVLLLARLATHPN
jgi:hypothetical protein